MAQSKWNNRHDENSKITKLTKLPKTNVSALESKRTALGELGNKTKNVIDKKPQTIGGSKVALNNLQLVKPRVDTRWKNDPFAKARSKESIKTKVVEIAPNVQEAQVKITKVKPNIKENHKTKLEIIQSILLKENAKKENIDKKDICKKEDQNLNIIDKETNSKSHSTSLLKSLETVSLNDKLDPYLLSEYVNDIYSYLYSLEIDFPIKENFLDDQVQVTPKMRAILINWINEVHCQFRLYPETYYMAVSIIDRYLQTITTTLKNKLQLVGIAALFLASKYEEIYPPCIKDFVFITDNTYDIKQLIAMEKKICKNLQFNLSKPLPIHFLRRYSKLINCDNITYAMAKYIMEIATIEFSLSHHRPSEIAAAALYLALKLFVNPNDACQTNESLWTPKLEHYTTHTLSHLKPIVRALLELIRIAPEVTLKAVFLKYKHEKFMQISVRPELSDSSFERVTTALNEVS